MKDLIKHKGIIENVLNDTVYVRIEQHDACSGCHAKSACMAASKKEKIIEVNNVKEKFSQGEKVILSAKSSSGMQAVVVAYGIPVLLILGIIIVGLQIRYSEVTVGLIALLALIPYYFILYFLREKLKNKFVFTVSKE